MFSIDSLFKFYEPVSIWLNGKHIYEWLLENTSNEPGKDFKSTQEIASFTNLTFEQVRKACAKHKKIFLCLDEEDYWSIFSRKPKSFYEERGMLALDW